MRYRADGSTDPNYPYSESMHQMLSLSMLLSILIGAVLLWLGIRSKLLWLKVWSAGLIVLSAAYLLADQVGWI